MLRLLGGLADADLRTAGTYLNALALALFVMTVIGSAAAWRLREAAVRIHLTTSR